MADTLGPPVAALAEYTLALADDELVLGHRDAEWTGHAPILEEDVAFSSIAQDEMGHALAWYTVAADLLATSPDELAFARPPTQFRNCTLLELPKGDWAFTIVRQYLFDTAEQVRLHALLACGYPALVSAARKLAREELYHLMHSKAWLQRLGDATFESHQRMQTALDLAWPPALALWEPVNGQELLEPILNLAPATALQAQWLDSVVPLLQQSGLSPAAKRLHNIWLPTVQAANGGRQGIHTPALAQLLTAMQSVYRLDPAAVW